MFRIHYLFNIGAPGPAGIKDYSISECVWQAFYEVAAMSNAEVKLQRDNSYQLVFLLNTPLEF